MTKADIQLNKQIEKTIDFLIAHGWCTGALAKDANGKPVSPLSKKATNFCAIGAFRAANKVPSGERLVNRHSDVFGPWNDLAEYNDEVATKKERVIGRLKKLLIT